MAAAATVVPASQQEVAEAVPAAQQEVAAVMTASQQMAKAPSSELKVPPEEAVERCSLVTTLPTVLIQARVTILRRRKTKDSG